MFTLAISCLATSNLPWFMDLTFQVPMQYHSYSIRLYFHHQSHPQLGIVFAFAPSLHFFLKLFLQCSPVAYWVPTILGGSSLRVISFYLFILFMGFSRQEYWSGLPHLWPVDHIFSELSTMACPSWVALHGMGHSFIELDKAVVQVISLVSFLWFWFLFFLPSDWIRMKALWNLPDLYVYVCVCVCVCVSVRK